MWPTVFEFPRAEWILWVLLTVGGYLLGSVHFCRWIPLLVKKVDVTKDSRDGNPGGWYTENLIAQYSFWKNPALTLSHSFLHCNTN